MALASYPGFYLTSPPGDATAFGVFWPTLVARDTVEETVVYGDGRRVAIGPPPEASAPTGSTPEAGQEQVPGPAPGPTTGGASRRLPLGTLIGARSGDKGGNANVGLWARHDRAYEWLRRTVGVDGFRALLPEASTLTVDRYELPNLRALNFVVHGLLGEGVASSTRPDAQAKSLGEYLRCRLVDIPEDVLAGEARTGNGD
jgi:hypothetical protein